MWGKISPTQCKENDARKLKITQKLENFKKFPKYENCCHRYCLMISALICQQNSKNDQILLLKFEKI